MDWKDTTLLDLAEAQRSVIRKRGIRMSHDCFNMITARDGQHAHCKYGYTPEEEMLIVVLGKCCTACKDCARYDTGS